MAFISFKESMKKLDNLIIEAVGVEKVYLPDTLGRVLAEDIIAKENSPLYPTAAMDGYAIIGKDQELGELEIIEVNPAGNDTEGLCVVPRTAIKTFTGALMPKGADTLIPIENVDVSDGKIIIKEPVATGFSVRPVGENFKEGEVLIKKGTTLSFAEIGVMASLNVVAPLVVQKPKVAILATGSEVLELGECSNNPAQIRSSNNYTLEALTKQHGGEPVQMGSVTDDRAAITTAMKDALRSANIVVTTGGVSVGDYDFVKDVIRDELGCDVIFKGVLIKPGQHIMVAQKGNRYIVALPGFAYSSTVTFILYVLPILYRLQGREFKFETISARLLDGYKKRTKNKTEFAACNLYIKDGEYICDFEGKRDGSSAIMTNMLGNVGLLWLEADENNKEAGERVQVLALR
ncbi:molybdopterin molybdotransferase MoeA [Hydrogenimonas thermophila]|uniref:molybdopterin molybdotransferase MoeA n=1 Tax=Hydrogenimonas thermophila TaxID=223786 RepID=UPI0029371134|nr:molybdopterin molybdotransferase MoeA [Hydrogenimonas thermophila]WOE70186.1 molybdopterin molybdotransferase MoeA [Hydrogenimonas thermophila]WOE72703.1 molybdopterin molybdotransferase MoeA [Hydrogenimonas thermophila]